MKKVILSIFVLLIVWFLIYSFYGAVQDEKIITAENDTIVTDIDYLKTYLEDNYANNYPVPEGDVILLNKRYEQIHLEDRNIPLAKIDDLYIIQWDICNLSIDDSVFQTKAIHKKFSPKDENWYKIKTCYKYAVTKDRTKYQIWYLEKNLNSDYVTKLAWNNSKSMIRSYDNSNMVEINSSKYLPYYPGATKWPIVFVEELWNNSSLSAEVNSKEIKLKVWKNMLINADTQLPVNIAINGKINDDDKVEIVYTDGSLIYIKPNKDGIIDFQLENYSPYEKDITMSLVTGRFLLNLVKYDSKKSVKVDNGRETTMAIRGTLFTVDSTELAMNTLLEMGKIKLFVGNKSQDIDIFSSFVNVDVVKKKITSNLSELSKLAQFMVMTDMLAYNPKINKNYKISSVNSFIPTEDLIVPVPKWYKNGKIQDIDVRFIRKKILDVAYNNGKKLQLHIFSGDLASMVYSNNRYKSTEVKDIIKLYCAQLWKKGAELSDLHYLLDVEKTDKENLLLLRRELSKKLLSDIDNMKFFTINKTHASQYSSRLTYKTKDKRISSWNFVDLNDIPTSVFICKD